MGIPLFFRYLVNNYDDIISSNKKLLNCNNLYLDLNCAIHYCCREILKDVEYSKQNKNKIEEKMLNNVLKYIELLYDYSKPNKLLFIAVDGPAPKAKMIQQRQRRFKKFYDKIKLNEILQEEGIEIPPDKEEWDTNAITPGTIFMDKLAHKLKYTLPNNPKYSKINIIISDSNIPGEGEHKLLDHIRTNFDKNKNDSNVIYGLDADLIMLCLVSRVPDIYLLRETVEFDNSIHKSGYKFLYLDIAKLRKHLLYEICERIQKYHHTEEEEYKLIDDYIAMSFILGNDFIPHAPSVSIKNSGIDLMFDLYTRFYDEYKENLVNKNTKKINHNFFKTLFRDLGLMEDSLLSDFNKKRSRKRKPNRVYESEYDRQRDLLNLFPQFNRETEEFINQGELDWRDRYYQKLFDINNPNDSENRYEIDKICHLYLEGIFWNFHYYNYGCISYEWCYPYAYPPTFNDLYNYMDRFISDINLLDIPKARPVKPFEQLLMVLPQQSSHLLPREYGRLMLDENSDIIEYYPSRYEIETTNKYYLWECSPKLPYVITQNIKDAVKDLKLNDDEKERNKFGKIYEINRIKN